MEEACPVESFIDNKGLSFNAACQAALFVHLLPLFSMEMPSYPENEQARVEHLGGLHALDRPFEWKAAT